ncbi:hypothetical protein [Halogeometricum pallidum]|nr:hypothetical protein [Halogeometricum pallidum]
MAPRRTAAFLAMLVLLSGVSVAASEVIESPPELTVSNEDNTTYRVTAYTVESRQVAMLMNFRVTTDNGERRLATLSQLIWPEGYRNVTLADEGVPTQRVTVEPGEEVTTTIDGWTPGNVTVYVMEDVGNDETHVQTDIIACPDRGQEHSWTFRDDGTGGSSTCASSLDWLLL